MKLTPRQRDVVSLLAEGLSNSQIASELGLTLATAERHLYDVYQGLGVVGEGSPRVLAVRWFLGLHPLGQPSVRIEDLRAMTLAELGMLIGGK